MLKPIGGIYWLSPGDFESEPGKSGQASGDAIQQRAPGTGRLGFEVVGGCGGGDQVFGGLGDRGECSADDELRAAAAAGLDAFDSALDAQGSAEEFGDVQRELVADFDFFGLEQGDAFEAHVAHDDHVGGSGESLLAGDDGGAAGQVHAGMLAALRAVVSRIDEADAADFLELLF